MQGWLMVLAMQPELTNRTHFEWKVWKCADGLGLYTVCQISCNPYTFVFTLAFKSCHSSVSTLWCNQCSLHADVCLQYKSHLGFAVNRLSRSEPRRQLSWEHPLHNSDSTHKVQCATSLLWLLHALISIGWRKKTLAVDQRTNISLQRLHTLTGTEQELKGSSGTLTI